MFNASMFNNQAPHKQLLQAAERGQVLRVQALLKQSAAIINVQDQYGYTPLHLAAENGHLEAVQVLLDNDADIGAQDGDGDTPLHLAAENGHLEAVQVLLDRGANIEAQDEDGDTPLHLAAENGHLEAVRLLLQRGANIEAQDDFEGSMPLHLAAKNGHLEAVQVFLDSGANIEAQDKYGNTPLHLAAKEGYVDIVRLLLEKKATMDVRDWAGYTPLHLAVMEGHVGIVRLLLANGAEIHTQNQHGSTPLHFAAASSKVVTVQVLLAAGANMHLTNKRGETALYYLVKGQDYNPATLVARISCFLDKGALLFERLLVENQLGQPQSTCVYNLLSDDLKRNSNILAHCEQILEDENNPILKEDVRNANSAQPNQGYSLLEGFLAAKQKMDRLLPHFTYLKQLRYSEAGAGKQSWCKLPPELRDPILTHFMMNSMIDEGGLAAEFVPYLWNEARRFISKAPAASEAELTARAPTPLRA